MSRRSLVAVTILTLLVGVAPTTVLARDLGTRNYLVRMSGDPAVAYEGGIPGLAATAPRPGRKIDATATNVARYVAHLADRQSRALLAVGGGSPLYSYAYAFNGFAAELTPAQARRLARQPGVRSVTPDAKRKLDTVSTPDFLGLTGGSGAWAELGGVANAGEGMVIGIIDSGIWPENESFAANGGNGKNKRAEGGYAKLKGWNGRCQGGEAFPSTACNQKLVGARYFTEGWSGYYPNAGGRLRKVSGKDVIKAYFPFEYISARDADGHGTHTASTAGGNNGVEAVVDGITLGTVSGMAPRARIAVYKVCWGADAGGCYDADSVAAIDAAVVDGVDALNFSISGSRDTLVDPVELAFYFAARAGIAISASAGNNGPGEGTVAHNSPWLMTTAAGTHDRLFRATVTLGNTVSYTGAGLGDALSSHTVVTSGDVAFSNTDATKIRQCWSAADNGGTPVLDPALANDKIIVCDRGGNNRTSKSLAVQEAGGVGMILVNTSANTINPDFHYVPTVHLPVTDRAAIYAYASGGAGTAYFSAGAAQLGAPAPEPAGFSSRGPALSSSANLLKPDIMAPGVDVLAAVSPDGYNGRNFDFLSGTSMSSPHMAGIMTLVKQAHPTWSPAAIKSALMTTASTVQNDDTTPIPGGVFAYGAGHVVPTRALDPGLVYDAGSYDWLGFLCATEPGLLDAGTCATLAGYGYSVTDPSQMNYPSIAVSSLTGSKQVTRRVKNVGNATETYDVAVDVPGFTSSSSKASFTLAAGDSTSFTLTFTRTDAEFNEFVAGQLVLTSRSNANHVVTSPIVLRPVAVSAPAEVRIEPTGGSYAVTFGYTGAFTASAYGPIAADTSSGMVADDPTNEFTPGGAGQVAYSVTIPAGTSVARFQLFDSDVSAGSDLDLFLYLGDDLVAESLNGNSNEVVTVRDPDPGTYTVYIHGWETASRAPSSYVLYRWLLGTSASGLLGVTAPGSATAGASGTITLAPTGLTNGRKYLGAIEYTGSDGMPMPTIVRFDKPIP